MGNLFGDGSGGPGVGGNILDPLDLRKSGATAATQYAADIQNQQAQQALALQQAQFNQVQQNLSPYLYAGYGALPYVAGGATAGGFGSMLAQIMGVGPDYNPGQPAMPPYQQIDVLGAPAFNPADYATPPARTDAGGVVGVINRPPPGVTIPEFFTPKGATVQQGGGITRNGVRYGWSPNGYKTEANGGGLSADEAAQFRAYQQGGGNPAGLTTGGVPAQPPVAAGAQPAQVSAGPLPPSNMPNFQNAKAFQPAESQPSGAAYAPKGARIIPDDQMRQGTVTPTPTATSGGPLRIGFNYARDPQTGERTVTPMNPNPQPAQTQQGSRPVQVGFTVSRTPDATYVAPVNPNTGQPIVTQNQLGQLISNQTGQPIRPAIPYNPATQVPGPGGTPVAAPQATYAPKPPYIPGVSPTGATGQPATGVNDPADPFQAIVAERMRAANNQLGQAGLLRSGAAAQAAADIPLDVALQIENMLYGRQANLAGSGQNAAVQQGGFGANTAANQANLLTQSGQALAQGALGRAQIQAGAQQNALNIAGTIASAYFSDPRLKMNMEPIGQIHDLTLYEWDWIPEVSEVVGKMSIGFNADEVAEKYPHHITEIAGFKAINYPALTAELRKELEDASG